MPPKNSSVLGPYANGAKWRLVIFEDGQRRAIIASTLDEAEKMKSGLLSMFANQSRLTIDAALDEYLDVRRRAGIKESSIATLDGKIRPFLPLDASLGSLTPERAAKLYLDETTREGRFGVVRAATHHKVLRYTKAFFAWTIERGYLRTNPFAGIKPVGRSNAGKPQLRQDEARRLTDLLLAEADGGDNLALALVTQLIMGLRSAEVLGLRVRDLDAGGTVLVIEGTKSKNARRSLVIEYAQLQTLLIRRCAGQSADTLIFGEGRATPFHTDRLYKALRKACQRAKVPPVCPHSLRGLHSSLAISRGATSGFVAAALGHGSDAVTKRHYIDSGTLAAASLKRVSDALTTPATPDLESLASTLRKLDPAQLASLLASISKAS